MYIWFKLIIMNKIFYIKKQILFCAFFLSFIIYGYSYEDSNIIDETQLKNKTEFYALKDVYKLTKVNAIDYTGKIADADMKIYQIEAEGEFESKDYAFDINSNTLYILGKKNASFYKILALEKNENLLRYTKCKTCEVKEFTIKLQNNQELILDIPSPDGKGFVFQLIFSK